MKRRIISTLLALVLGMIVVIPVCTVSASASEEFLVDEADILTEEEELALTEKLRATSHKHNVQILIVALYSTGGNEMDLAIEYVYDGMEYGYGKNHDGVLLLVNMEEREYRILSNGIAAPAIEDDEIDAIGDAMVSDLSDGDYADAFCTYVEMCDYYLEGHLNGFPFNAGKSLLISLIVGVVLSALVALVLVGQLKTVRKQKQANVYVKSGSMQVTERNDIFLYRNVTSKKRESSKSSSSSGSSRNVGGGSF